MSGLFLTTDLIFSSRVTSLAQSHGLQVQPVGSLPALLEKASGHPVQLVILDLTAPGCDPQQAVAELQKLNPAPKIVAYGPHVNEAQLAAAQQAGCDEVLPRGQFNQQLSEILQRYLHVRT